MKEKEKAEKDAEELSGDRKTRMKAGRWRGIKERQEDEEGGEEGGDGARRFV